MLMAVSACDDDDDDDDDDVDDGCMTVPWTCQTHICESVLWL